MKYEHCELIRYILPQKIDSLRHIYFWAPAASLKNINVWLYYKSYIKKFEIQWRHQGGHTCRGICSPVRWYAHPYSPPIRREQLQKTVIFDNFLIFAPSEMHFSPFDAPKNLVLLLSKSQAKFKICIQIYKFAKYVLQISLHNWSDSPSTTCTLSPQ